MITPFALQGPCLSFTVFSTGGAASEPVMKRGKKAQRTWVVEEPEVRLNFIKEMEVE